MSPDQEPTIYEACQEIKKLRQRVAALEAAVKEKMAQKYIAEICNDRKFKKPQEVALYADHLAALGQAVREKDEKIDDLELKLQSANMDFDLQYGAKDRALERIVALTAENERLRDRLKAAENVVSYVVIWGAAPTNKLAELVKRSMEFRMKDKETLCIPSKEKL